MNIEQLSQALDIAAPFGSLAVGGIGGFLNGLRLNERLGSGKIRDREKAEMFGSSTGIDVLLAANGGALLLLTNEFGPLGTALNCDLTVPEKALTGIAFTLIGFALSRFLTKVGGCVYRDLEYG